mgnify:CR=1 FL=1
MPQVKERTKTDNIVDVRDLKVYFPVFGGVFLKKVAEVKAVDGVTFSVKRGETLGLVGESGCGKTTIGKALINLVRPTGGKILFKKEPLETTIDLARINKEQMRPLRADIQMIFQDPYSSLNPRMSVQEIIEEPLKIHRKDLSAEKREETIRWLLKKVGLTPEQASRYPHEFSGGQRQRIGVARALSTKPKFIIADEPVSALDVSIQAQVINLLQDLQDEFKLTYLFIAHDLSVVEHISGRIAVMYLGNMVEIGSSYEVNTNPIHPYTQALISAVPKPDPSKRGRKRIILKGDVPSPLHKPSGCAFRTRCPIAKKECAERKPELIEKKPGHFVACPF